MAEYEKGLSAYRLREVEFYKQHTSDPEKARQPATAFLTATITYSTTNCGTTSWDDVCKLRDRALAEGSTDPVVLGWAAPMVAGPMPETKPKSNCLPR